VYLAWHLVSGRSEQFVSKMFAEWLGWNGGAYDV